MDYMQFFGLLVTFVGSVIGALAWFHRDLKQTIAEIREDVKIQSLRIDQQAARTDQLYSDFQEGLCKQTERTDQLYTIFTEKLEQQAARSDQLYTMFIDLLKAKK